MTELKESLSLEQFRMRATHLGLTLSEDDIGHLHKGYVGLLQMMERIPKDCALEAEGAHIFRPLAEVER